MFVSMLGEDFCERRMLKDFYDIIKGFVDDDTSIEGSTEKQQKLEQTITEKPNPSVHDNGNQGNKNTTDHDKIEESRTDDSDVTKTTSESNMVVAVSAPAIPTHNPADKESLPESVVLPCKVTSCVSTCEDEKIAEYLNRSDTAVIYPEPVSDREEVTEDGEDDNDSSVCLEEEDFVLKCVYCELTFVRASVLQEHLKTTHPDKPLKYQCPKCEETFHLKTHLDKHLALHSPTSQACKVCSKTFANVYRLQRHMISHNESTDLRKFKCTQCGKAFKFKHHLKEHVRIHSGEKPFECSNCHKRFSHSGSYSSHMTSKKCWIAGHQVKGHGQTGNSSTSESNPSMPYTAPHTAPNATIHSSVSSVAPSMASTVAGFLPHLPFMHFSPAIAAIPGMYPPPGHILPITAYSMLRHGTPLKPISTLPHPKPLDIPLPKPDTPHGKPQDTTTTTSKPTGGAPQISPDVNSNTQLVSIQKMEIKQEAETEGEKSTEVRVTEGEKSTDVRVKEERKERDDDATEKEGSSNCKYCGEKFSSAVEQHQHERYLCKSNRDIAPRVPHSDSSRNSPCSTVSDSSRHGTPNGSLSAMETDGEDGEELYKEDVSADGKKFRMRSLINDEQLSVLKSYYQMNPRPRKYELIRIGNEIGFSKRVVQVWFQNMRARDRRQGKNVPYFPSMARFKRQEPGSAGWKDSKPAYIPVIPNPTLAHNGKVNGHVSTAKTKASEEQPLDLSVKPSKAPTPQGAAASTGTTAGTTPNTTSSTTTSKALNLSTRSDKPSLPATFHNSSIYKYMQQEGLFGRQFLGHHIATTIPNMMHPIFANPRRDHAIMNHQEQKMATSGAASSTQRETESSSSNHGNDERAEAPPSDLVIDESHDDSSSLSSSDDSESDNPYARMSHDPAAMADATLNLATLAEVSLSHRAAIFDSNIKSKRLRKKSWRQMEAEEAQMDLEDSLLDEDHPLRKKRRSWKGHKVTDADEGMYACDQCKKMFSKQSSLARHKYEHSGARPFTCEICAKAFKHKHHLTEHRRLHSGEKPFVCNKCGKRFSHSGSYSQHMNHRYKYCKPMRNDDGFSSM